MDVSNVEFELKILFPRSFEALRRYHCGTQTDFISSVFKVKPWATSGGKTMSDFFKTHDEKYVLKEVKKSEFKMFVEFGPSYFEYMSKVLFQGVPSVLAKILGVYVIKIK